MVATRGVLLTGASGFLGRQVLARLLDAGFAVLATYRPCSLKRPPVTANGRLVWYPTDQALPAQFLGDYGLSAIIHAATSYGHDGQGLAGIAEANVLLPLRIIDQLNVRGIGCDFINFGTSIPACTNAYALTKAHFVDSLRLLADERAEWRAINLVFHYIYGADEIGSKFSAGLIAACRNRDAVFRMTEGTQARDFLYVHDAADAAMAVLQSRTQLPFGFTAMDVGTGKATSLKEFAESVIRISRAPTKPDYGAIRPRACEPPVLVADTAPLARLGWRARTDIETGLRLVFKENQS